MRRMRRSLFREIADQLTPDIDPLAVELLGAPSRRGREELRFGRKGSLCVTTRGAARGCFYDHEAGKGGDALALIAHVHGTPMRDALEWAVAWLAGRGTLRPANDNGPLPAHNGPSRLASGADRNHPSGTAQLAKSLWADAMPIPGTPAEQYLRAARGLPLPGYVDSLRYHPRAWRNRRYGPPGPAMIARMTCPETGQPTGVHVTRLRPDGSGKAEGADTRIMLGKAGVVRLSPDDEVTLGLGVAEGIETALSVMAFGWTPVWALLSAGGIRRFPVLPGIKSLTIFADADHAGMGAAEACAARWEACGREARIFAPEAAGLDINDAWTGTLMQEPAP
jgi:putative DNA primase/helicase